MSVVLAFHDEKRAIVACDARSTYLSESGELLRAPGNYPKMRLLSNNLILIASGMTPLVRRLLNGTATMVEDYPKTTFSHLADFLPFAARKMFASRQPFAMPEMDTLACGLIGFDQEQQQIRACYWFSRDDFKPFEVRTNDQRISCAGFIQTEDKQYLQSFTWNVGIGAKNRGAAWIASALRIGIERLHTAHPNMIDSAQYYLAVDQNGRVDLGEDFPAPAPSDFEAAPASRVAVGHAATIDISAFDMAIPGINYPELDAGAITGLQYGTQYFIYYLDPGFLGGEVIYQVTTEKSAALGSAGTFFVGSITTPPAGGAPTTGNNDGGSGAQWGNVTDATYTVASAGSTGSGGSVTNALNAIDGNTVTYATISSTSSSTNFIILTMPPSILPGSSATLTINYLRQVTAVGGAATLFAYLYNQAGSSILYTLELNSSPTVDAAPVQVSVSLPVTINLNQYQFQLGGTGPLTVELFDVRFTYTQ